MLGRHGRQEDIRLKICRTFRTDAWLLQSRFRGVLGHTFGLPVDPPVNSMKKGLIRIKENVGNPRVLIQHGRRDDLRAGRKIAGTIRKQKRRRQGFKTSIKALSGEGIRENETGSAGQRSHQCCGEERFIVGTETGQGAVFSPRRLKATDPRGKSINRVIGAAVQNKFSGRSCRGKQNSRYQSVPSCLSINNSP